MQYVADREACELFARSAVAAHVTMVSPTSSDWHRKWIDRLDWSVAALLTLGAIILQIVNFRHAAAGRRGEVARINLAQLPS